ncbi:MAG: oxidoreductase, partial [Desulfovibrionales bacterium]
HLLTKGMPAVDEYNRPIMFFGETVHDRCERLPHFDNGEFAPSFGSEEARKGWCLYELGCKGPYTYNNCPTVKFNQVNWPVQAGHPCIGCSEPKFWDWMTPFYEPS